MLLGQREGDGGERIRGEKELCDFPLDVAAAEAVCPPVLA